jgi:hypothetical protein
MEADAGCIADTRAARGAHDSRTTKDPDMKHILHLSAALVATLGLVACEKTVVTPPTSSSSTTPSVVTVPGPAGPKGDTVVVPGPKGDAGMPGAPGKTGDAAVVVVPPPADAASK